MAYKMHLYRENDTIFYILISIQFEYHNACEKFDDVAKFKG